jgi:hypothetical protein
VELKQKPLFPGADLNTKTGKEEIELYAAHLKALEDRVRLLDNVCQKVMGHRSTMFADVQTALEEAGYRP